MMLSGLALAQLHWDVGAEAGVMNRFTSGAAPGAPEPEPGPVAQVVGHVAVVPMLRGGVYLAYDVAPLSRLPARQTIEAGLQMRLVPPLLPSPWRTWVFLGLGYARTVVPSHSASGGSANALVPAAAGGILELPFGFGLGYRLSRPWQIFTELGGRAGLAFAGDIYDRSPCICGEPYLGRDSIALSLSVGVSLGD